MQKDVRRCRNARGAESDASGRRNAALDGLRGVLAPVVAAAHTRLPWDSSQALLKPGLVAVIVFFVMSGYALTRAWDGRPLVPEGTARLFRQHAAGTAEPSD